MLKDRNPTIARRLDLTDRLERARLRIVGIARQQQSFRFAAQRGDSAAQRVLDTLDRDRRKAEEDAGWLTVALADLEIASDPAASNADAKLLEPDEGEERACGASWIGCARYDGFRGSERHSGRHGR